VKLRRIEAGGSLLPYWIWLFSYQELNPRPSWSTWNPEILETTDAFGSIITC